MIDSACTLSYGDGNVIVRKDAEYNIPISQIKSILVNTNNVMISSALMNELSKNNIRSVFCNSKHNPSFEIAGFSDNNESAGRIIDQKQWSEDNKRRAWQRIVKLKINNQCNLLKSR